jgi:FlaG/FlaF family flagellin (archaellin)
MVAIVVILAATVSVFALGFTDEANQPGPVVGQSTGTLEPNPPGSGSDNGFVRIRHVASNTIQTADMETVVDATDACRNWGRLVNIPVDGYSGNAIGSTNIEGDDIFDDDHPISLARNIVRFTKPSTWLARKFCSESQTPIVPFGTATR